LILHRPHSTKTCCHLSFSENSSQYVHNSLRDTTKCQFNVTPYLVTTNNAGKRPRIRLLGRREGRRKVTVITLAVADAAAAVVVVVVVDEDVQ